VSTIERSIDVDVPVRTAYDQWTQFEEFPHFMDNVERIEQLDDTHVRWHVSVAGADRSFDTVITEQQPDQRIAWTTEPDAESKHAGVVTFHRIDEGRTRVMVQMDMEPTGAAEKVGDLFGFTDRSVGSDLENFKRFVEERGIETGAWRGEVDQSTTH
jgi:uncharacterized membrane protein